MKIVKTNGSSKTQEDHTNIKNLKSCISCKHLLSLCLCRQPGTVLIMKSHEDQPLPQCILPHHPPAPPPVSKPRYDANARKASPSTVNKGTAATAGQEGEFPCKKCGRLVSGHTSFSLLLHLGFGPD